MDSKSKYEVIVVGAGHAGCEAALAAARMGCSTLLLTISLDNPGRMSCNPAIGGLAKGHLVKEIDALGGMMGLAADYAGIHYKRLNTSKGPAVRSSRVQADRDRYSAFVKRYIRDQDNLDTAEGCLAGPVVRGGKVCGIRTESGEEYNTSALVVTPGTFLNGTIHEGLENYPGGRIDERAVSSVSDFFRESGFRMFRFKTGTCARLEGKTIDFSKLKIQQPDEHPSFFSFMTDALSCRQVPCYITYTNEKTHDIIRSGFDRSPLYTGVIKGTGVRYCPSLEDKLIKFSHMKRHHVFLEPEGLDTDLYYPNGISTSLPHDIQDMFIHSIEGLEEVKIIKYGYGIEHDVVDPTELDPALQTKRIAGLFLAGQINGTTGYEEAGAQGLIAGINAAASVKGQKPLILGRHEAYIGVLIDDLVTGGTEEPYRMFTSRAEYRLILREDNAHLRLTQRAKSYGCIQKEYLEKFREFKKNLESAENIINNIIVVKDSRVGQALSLVRSSGLKTVLKKPGTRLLDLKEHFDDLRDIDDAVLDELDIQIKYEGYIKRQEIDIMKTGKMDSMELAPDLDYSGISGLSNEIIEKLCLVKPRTLGQASRISGVTPAAVTTLMIYLRTLNK